MNRQRRNFSAYPICWATQLGPVSQSIFIRGTTSERDEEEAKQARMALQWRQLRDPDFNPSDYHVHHVVPLFLGGSDDLRGNGTTIPKNVHLMGHSVLAYQPQMLMPPAPLISLPANLYNHPVGTIYELVGYKQGRNDMCD